MLLYPNYIYKKTKITYISQWYTIVFIESTIDSVSHLPDQVTEVCKNHNFPFYDSV